MGEPIPSDRAHDGAGVHDATRPRRRRTPRRPPSRSASRSRLRGLFFGAAAAWGFLTGSAAILVGLSVTGHRAEVGPLVWGALVIALVVAVLGGLVVSRAYRETASRR